MLKYKIPQVFTLTHHQGAKSLKINKRKKLRPFLIGAFYLL